MRDETLTIGDKPDDDDKGGNYTYGWKLSRCTTKEYHYLTRCDIIIAGSNTSKYQDSSRLIFHVSFIQC